ncbi:peptidase S58 DmpA [Gemmatirosa kalamazoonensis]|uniref:Peptidase S58 DmpA n=1 Tax=Gemmatirosa kalamazoonensis TaxID=861299 RepID=W0RFV8_9BACT|nr:P1 family peptidase [Gemmatirosa kalamazoonensis]AHG89200.1 peptidase S58 DmpA [Gemmatirosa kalamazoonensis]
MRSHLMPATHAALATVVALVGARALTAQPMSSTPVAPGRARARDLGVAPGVFAPGRWNAITDVDGVRVGHATVTEGDSVRTGVTAILPPGDDWFRDRVPAAIVVGNGFGKLLGSTQVNELGELETPVLLTCTLCVWRAADALVDWLLARPGMDRVRSINPVVAETNDGTLNAAIRSRPVRPEHVRAALDAAASGAVAEGTVGAGAGTIAFGWKGGIGTSSRKLPASLGGWTVGVLVQSNFGGVLQVAGAPVGKELGRHPFVRALGDTTRGGDDAGADGSIVMVVATDAPIGDRNLRRLASRALLGLGRTGSYASNGSGDYVIAFSTSPKVRRNTSAPRVAAEELPNDGPDLSAVFAAAAEATEEAIYDSIFAATTVTSRGGTVEAIPLDRVRAVLMRHGIAPR